MKNTLKHLLAFTISFLAFFIFTKAYSQKMINGHPDYRNFYGISWRGTPHENLAYAKQMKYDYVFYQPGMEKNPLSNGLYFYIETPEYFIYNRALDISKSYTKKQIDFFEKTFALINNQQPFPDNIAKGWVFNDHTFTPILDFQQERVISWAVDSILNFAARIEKANPSFHFGGFAWDVPQPAGDFWKDKRQVTLKAWTGGDYGAEYQGVVHEYNTYSNGHIAFYNLLFKKARIKYPYFRTIIEPYKVYDEWFGPIKDSPDAKEIMPDIVCEEGPGTEFIDDIRIYKTGLVKKSNMASTTPNKFSEADNRMLAAKAATNGALFTWFGRFGGTGDMSNFKSITEVPPRLKLIRVLTEWENLNLTPLENRSWDGKVYSSNNAFASSDLIWALQPNTRKIFFVFLTQNGKLIIPAGKRIVSISRTDNLFTESEDGRKDLSFHGNIIESKDTTSLNKGYILKLD